MKDTNSNKQTAAVIDQAVSILDDELQCLSINAAAFQCQVPRDVAARTLREVVNDKVKDRREYTATYLTARRKTIRSNSQDCHDVDADHKDVDDNDENEEEDIPCIGK